MSESALPIIERIAQAIEAALQTVPSVLGSAVAGVVRPTRLGGYTPRHLLILLEQGDSEPNLEESAAGNPPALAWNQPFTLTLMVRPSDRDTTPIDTILNHFRCEVEKVLMADVQWDGLARSASLGQTSKVLTQDAAYEGLELTYTVVYRTAENDPTALR